MTTINDSQGAVLWLTGLSGAGKSAIATTVAAKLVQIGVTTSVLDGDAVRAVRPTGFNRADRSKHVRQVGRLASRLESNGVTVICALISPYREDREAVRHLCRVFIEIYVRTPLEECERRDVKGLYARARRGELSQFTGLDDPYEAPESPEIEIDTRHLSVEAAATQITHLWRRAQGMVRS